MAEFGTVFAYGIHAVKLVYKTAPQFFRANLTASARYGLRLASIYIPLEPTNDR